MISDNNLVNKQHRRLYSLFLPLIIVLFIISRLSYLSLPFYWDEAWSYATAIFNMARESMAFLPGDSDPEMTRGHPIVFYFLAALWVKIIGINITMVHLFPLVISAVLLITIFIVAHKLFDKATAVTAIVLFTLQSVFLAQSTMLLPEVMLALWTILTAYTYFRRKWGLFIVFSILLVMTKETGMILIGTLFFDKIIIALLFSTRQGKPGFRKIRELLIMTVPVLVFIAYIITQKIRFGWFLYPEHVQLMTLNPDLLLNRFRINLSKLLFQYGRNIFFFVSLMACGYLLIKKKLNKQHAHYLLFSLVFIVFFISFSSVNFFTPRYLLSVFPFFIISGSWLITAWLKNNWLKTSVVAVFAILFAYYTFNGNLSEQDTSLGYKNTVLLQKQAVNFAEEMHWQDKSVYSTFLMQYYLSVPDLGYLKDKKKPFLHISGVPGNHYDIYLFCSNEKDPLYAKVQQDKHYTLIKKFESKGAWVEIFDWK